MVSESACHWSPHAEKLYPECNGNGTRMSAGWRHTRPMVVMGDYNFGVCAVMSPRPCFYMTVLRDPRRRLVSSYLYCQDKHRQNDQLCMSQLMSADSATLEQWAHHQGNYLARQLSFELEGFVPPPRVQVNRYQEWLGLESSPSQPMNILLLQEHERGGPLGGRPTDAQIASMVSELERIFAVIGLLERYEESLKLFNVLLGTPGTPAAAPSGGGAEDPPRTRADRPRAEHKRDGEDMDRRRARQDELVRQLEQNPAWLEPIKGDLSLYEEAKRIFELQLTAAGLDRGPGKWRRRTGRRRGERRR